jgi:hypothetical protein
MAKMSIGESLEDYARRTGRSVDNAYPDWHEHGNAVARAYAEPCARLDPNDTSPHVTIAGGRCFGIRA